MAGVDGAARCSTVSVSFGSVAAQVQVRVAPGMELGRSAQRLTGAQAAATLFGMMHEEDCETVASLQFSQIGEERRDLAAGVLVDPVQPHERIQDQQPGREIGDGLLETSHDRRADRAARSAR